MTDQKYRRRNLQNFVSMIARHAAYVQRQAVNVQEVNATWSKTETGQDSNRRNPNRQTIPSKLGYSVRTGTSYSPDLASHSLLDSEVDPNCWTESGVK